MSEDYGTISGNLKQIIKNPKIIAVLVSLVLISIGVIGLNYGRFAEKSQKVNQDRYKIAETPLTDLKKNSSKKVSYDYSSVKPINALSQIEGSFTKSDFPIIGGIAIPELKINLSIFKGIDSKSLMFGAGTLKDGQQMGKGNYALASHHIFDNDGYSGAAYLFSPLMNAQKGQKIYLTDKEKVYEYEINNIEVIPANGGEIINDVNGEKLVTLVTCEDYAATMRRVIQGELIKVMNYNDDSAQYFNQAYNENPWG